MGRPWIRLALLGALLVVALQGVSCEQEPTESQCRPYIEKALKQHVSDEDVRSSSDGSIEQEENSPTDEITDSTEGSTQDTNEDDDDDDDDDDTVSEERDDDDETEEDTKDSGEDDDKTAEDDTEEGDTREDEGDSGEEDGDSEEAGEPGTEDTEEEEDEGSEDGDTGEEGSVEGDTTEVEESVEQADENDSVEGDTEEDEGSVEGDTEEGSVEGDTAEEGSQEEEASQDPADTDEEGDTQEDDGSVEGDTQEEEDGSVEGDTKEEDDDTKEEDSQEGETNEEDVSVEGDTEEEDGSVEGDTNEDEDASVEGDTKEEDDGSVEGDTKEDDDDDDGDDTKEDDEDSVEVDTNEEDASVEGDTNEEDDDDASIEADTKEEDEDSQEGDTKEEDDEDDDDDASVEGDTKEDEDDSVEGDTKEDDGSVEGDTEEEEDESVEGDTKEEETKEEEDDSKEGDTEEEASVEGDTKEEESVEGDTKEEESEEDKKEDVSVEGDTKEEDDSEEEVTKSEPVVGEALKKEEAPKETTDSGKPEDDSDEELSPEEDLTREVVIPDNLRPRDHITKILRLDEESVQTESALATAIDKTLHTLKGLYDNAIKPLEILYKYRDLSNRHFGDPEIFSKPLILFMGPWSGGKSSTINYLLNNEFTPMSLRTGAEPSPAYFNILMHGQEEEILDGTQLAADWTFSGLQKFGQGLLDRLRGVRLPNRLLEKVNIVEIPGILEIRKQVQRLFPFNDACQWFIDRADIIFLVYDPAKLDVGPETEAILDQLKGREYQTRIILNKADQVKPEELMRVQGTLIWNISPLMSSTEPPVMYSTSLWSLPYEVGAPTRLLMAQERAFLRDLREAVDRRVENKIASARRFAVRVRNHAKMVDCYLTTYYNHKTFFGNRKKTSDDIIEYPQRYHIYEGLSTLTNISRYDLPDPDVYRDFFKINPLYDFIKLSDTCTYFRGCPINKLDIAIAYDLPELAGKHKKGIESAKEKANQTSQQPPTTKS